MKRLLALMVVVAVAVCVGCSKETPKKAKTPVKETPPPTIKGPEKPADTAPAEKKDVPPPAEKKDVPPAEKKDAPPPAPEKKDAPPEKKDAPPPAPEKKK